MIILDTGIAKSLKNVFQKQHHLLSTSHDNHQDFYSWIGWRLIVHVNIVHLLYHSRQEYCKNYLSGGSWVSVNFWNYQCNYMDISLALKTIMNELRRVVVDLRPM